MPTRMTKKPEKPAGAELPLGPEQRTEAPAAAGAVATIDGRALLPVPASCAEIERVAQECSLVLAEADGKFERAFLMAAGIQRLRALIGPEEMGPIMALQGTPLGFRTDKDKETNKDGGYGYPIDVVKEAVIEAVLRGVYPVGNEFNIIAGRCYITKEGYQRKVREYPRLTDLRIMLQIPLMKAGGAVVPCSATWKVNGEPDTVERDIPVKVNLGMGVDAVLGKATRKLLASVWQRLTGSLVAEPEGDVDDLPPAEGPDTGQIHVADLAAGEAKPEDRPPE